MSLRRLVHVLGFGLHAGVLASVISITSGCTDKGEVRPRVTEPIPTATVDAGVGASKQAAQQPTVLVADGGSLAAFKDAAYDGPYLAGLFMQSPIMSDMEWPLPEGATRRDPSREGVKRIGYIRRGAKAPVIPQAIKKANCLEGWYELVAGGFVCGKYASLDMNHPRVKLAPHLPYMDAPLPYQYGYNLTHGAPLYRTVPSRDERVALEPWLSAKAKKKAIEEANPYETLDAGGGAAADTVQASIRGPSAATGTDPLGAGLDPLDGGVPWYLREHDGGKPQITLDELRGEGPMVRRMVRGFYLSLDKELRAEGGSRWWKNTEGFIAPYERVFVNDKVTSFHGVWMNESAGLPGPALASPPPPQPVGDAGIARLEDGGFAEPAVKVPTKLPIGFMLWRGRKYVPSKDGTKMVSSGDTLPRFTAVGLTGKTMRNGGFTYHESEEGWWMRQSEGRVASQAPLPRDLKPGEKWVDVDLATQTLVAYEGEKAVFATLVSTGKRDNRREKNFETKPGTWRIREKHIAATMDGDVASDGPYSIEDVPWIMYFNGSIALHGAFWHTNFGNTRSHGCVNLAPLDARTLFFWTEPSTPEGWHGVWSSGDKPGTLIVVRSERK